MNRFRPQSRLLLASDYHAVFNGNPYSVSDRLFRLLAVVRFEPDASAAQTRGGASRLGLAIAKKNVRKASQRNRIKRQAREAFRNFAALQQAKLCSDEDSPKPTRLDIVVLARPAAANADKAELRASLERLLQQLLAISQRRSTSGTSPAAQAPSHKPGTVQPTTR